MNPFVAALATAPVVGGALAWAAARARGMDCWLAPYLAQRLTRSGPPATGPVRLLLCVADHFEPRHGVTSTRQADERVDRWVLEYPRLFGGFRDSDGRPPRHTFF